jgi:acetoacetyl-CoA synthetase
VEELEDFWESVWQYFKLKSSGRFETMPGAKWFYGSRLNYAEHALEDRDQ